MPLGNPIRKQNESRIISVLATEGQSVFTIEGGYIINQISVFRNGVRLSNAEDFTAGDGSTVTLNDEANVDDRIEFHIFDKFTVQNAIVGAASSQTINGDLVLTGKLFGNLDVPSINTGIITATTLKSTNLTSNRVVLTTAGGELTDSSNLVFTGSSLLTTINTNIQGNIDVVGVTTVGKQIHVGTGVSIAAGGLNVTAGISTFQAVQGTTGTFTSTVKSGTIATGTIFSVGDSGTSGDRVIQFKRAATTNDINIQAINSGSGATNLLFNQEGGAASFGGALSATTGTFSGQLRVSDGSTSAPSLAASSDTNSGLYFAGADALGLVVGGSRKLLANSSGVTINNGDLTIDDKIIHQADTDTAIRFPAADTFTVETGGTERARVDSVGNILLGLTSTLSSNNARLQVAHTDGNADIIVHRAGNNANPPGLNFQKTRNASIGNYGTIVQDDDELGSIRWGGADGSAIAFAARIVGAVDGTPGANDMPGRIQFHTSADGSEGMTERIRINSSGQLLSGVTDNAGANDANAVFGGGGAAGTNNYGKLYITQSTSNPTSGTAIGFIGFSSQDLDNKPFAFMGVYADADHGTNDYPSRFAFWTTADGSSSASERLRITSGGKVNIGGDYTNTTSTLRVIGDSNAGSQTFLEKNSGSTNNTYNTSLTISSRSTGSAAANYGPAIGFQHSFGSSNYAGSLIASQCNSDANTADLVFYPRNYGYTEALRIASGGNVGINTAAPSRKFEISGGTNSIYNFTINGGNTSTGMKMGNYTASAGYNKLSVEASDILFYTGTAGGFSSTERMRINSSGQIGMNANPDASGGLVQIKYNEVYTSGTTNLLTSASKAALRIRTSSDSSKSLYFGGIDESATPYLQVANMNASAGGANASYPMMLNPYGGDVGIGENTLSQVNRKLFVSSDQNTTNFKGTEKGTIAINNSNYSSGELNAIDFTYNSSVNPVAKIAAEITGNGSRLYFGTSQLYSSGVTELAVRIGYDMDLPNEGIRLFDSSNAYEAMVLYHTSDHGNGTTAISPVTNPGSGISQQYIKLKNTGSGSGNTYMNLVVDGSISKGSGSFLIDHPLPSLSNTKTLRHSFIEGPQCDNIYRGKVTLSSGTATVNLDTVSNMTDGTFVVLNRDIQCFTSNESGWDAVKGSVSGNILTITSQNNSSTDTISWMVVGERQDAAIKESDLTDANGNLLVEEDK